MTGAFDIIASDLIFPESLRWHAGRLWFVDMYGGTMISLAPGEQARVEYRQRGFLGGIGWPDGDGAVVASKLDRALVTASGDLWAQLPKGDGPINDAVSLPDGGLLVGEYGFDMMRGADFAPGRLFRVSAKGNATIAAEGLAFPNGMALDPSGRGVFVAETMNGRISRFALTPEGALGERTTFAELGKAQPDGMACDESGRLWVACRRDDEVIRLNLAGEIDMRIGTPRKPADVCVSGDGAQLYIAVSDGTAQDLGKDPVPRTGQLLRCAAPS